MATSTATAALISYIHSLKYEHLPPTVVAQAKRVILDALGCDLGCSTLPPGQIMLSFVRSLGDRPEASVIGADFRASAINAALANGTLGHGDEVDDAFVPFGHPAAMVVTAALAVGEKEHRSGKEMMTAVVLGYDLASRLARANLGIQVLKDRHFHASSVAGSLCAAGVAGKMLGLDEKRLDAALSLASSQASGLMSFLHEDEHMTKSFQTGLAARNGVTAAYLAHAGYRPAPASAALEGRDGVFAAFAGSMNAKAILAELGQRFDIMDTALKSYSAGHPIHAAVDALLKILSEKNLTAAEVREIVVRSPRWALDIVGNAPTPSINLPYCVAVAAYDRKLFWEQFTPERQADPKVQELKGRVRAVADPELSKGELVDAAIVEVVTGAGQRFTEQVTYPIGHPRNPMSQQQVEQKFRELSSRAIPREQAQQLMARIGNLETVADLNELGNLVRR